MSFCAAAQALYRDLRVTLFAVETTDNVSRTVAQERFCTCEIPFGVDEVLISFSALVDQEGSRLVKLAPGDYLFPVRSAISFFVILVPCETKAV